MLALGLGLPATALKCESVRLGPSQEFQEGKMYEVSVGSGDLKVLVARLQNQLYATSAKCSHYGAPLVKGVLGTQKSVVCPWHDAAFSLEDGRVLRGPTMNPLSAYQISEQNGEVIVEIPDKPEPPKLAERDPANPAKMAIVGGGYAGFTCAQTLREKGFTGGIFLFSEELPYDRTMLSKNLTAEWASVQLATREYLENSLGVEIKPKAQKIDGTHLKIETEEGEYTFDKLLIATGASPNKLFVPGIQLPQVVTLRSFEDAQKLSAMSDAQANQPKKVVVIGSSFIGMEAAGALCKKGCEVTVVGMEQHPFENILGKRIGAALAQYALQKFPNLQLRGRRQVKRICGDSQVSGVELDDGLILQADLVICAIGVSPNTQMVEDLPLGADASILVNPFLSVDDRHTVFGAGDVARYPEVLTGETARIEHWNVAGQQGRVAAANMTGAHQVFQNVPFFWSNFFGMNLRFAGYAPDYEDIIIEGDLNALQFVAYFTKGDEIQGVLTMGKDPVAAAASELLRVRKMPKVSQLHLGAANSQTLLDLLERREIRELN